MKISFLKLFLLFFSLTFFRPEFSSAQKNIATVSEADLESWVSYLSSDNMRGRKNGSPELKEAAQYIAAIFKDLGLKPLPGMNDYFQKYPIKGRSGNTFTETNVIGYLEGNDKKLKEEYIILSAHYDHIGLGPVVNGDSIYNGADDNASGVATVLGIAKALSESKGKAPKRSIIFVAFSGEEIGLLGSKHFAQNPPVPIKKVVANFNFEMTGHSEKLGKRKFYITGEDFSSISEFVGKQISKSEWEQIADPFKEMQLFYRSDNASLATIKKEGEIFYGIPAHTFCTWGAEAHYHQAHDHADAIDYENMASFVNMMSVLTRELANSKEWIEWKEEKFRRF